MRACVSTGNLGFFEADRGGGVHERVWAQPSIRDRRLGRRHHDKGMQGSAAIHPNAVGRGGRLQGHKSGSLRGPTPDRVEGDLLGVAERGGSSNSRMRGPSARDFRRHNSGVQWCLLRASHPWYLGSARRNGVGLRSRRNPTRDIRVEGVPMAHLAPGRQRDWGPSCFSRHWTPEPCLKKSRGEAASV